MYMFFGLVKTGNGIKIVNGKKARLFIPRAQRVEESGGSRGRERVLRQWQAAGRLVAKRQRMRRLSAAMRVEHGVIPPAAVNRGKNKRGKWAAEGDARVGGNTARRAWTNCQYQMHPAKGRRTTSDGAYWRQKWLEEAAPIRAGASIPGPYRRHPCARKTPGEQAGNSGRARPNRAAQRRGRRRAQAAHYKRFANGIQVPYAQGGPEKSFRGAEGAEPLLRGVPAERCPCARRIQGSIHKDPGSEESMKA
ncbi:hypothetical protein B0H11DRAFT_1934525 [Mycena galericulata]|nr:hypothetical protein B0H11DRAFT_1934525 [Mycena galericulata]